MRIDVVPTADAVTPDRVEGTTALVIDVLRASTTIITALGAGTTAVVPVAEPEEARRRATDGALVAGERHALKIEGFDLGNSPVEFAAAPLTGRTVVLTTSNGTRALLAARSATAIGIAALINRIAAADWAVAEDRDTTIVCSGDLGRPSLDDSVCAGLLVARLTACRPDAGLTPDAEEALETARPYFDDITLLGKASRWARRLVEKGFGADVDACLRLDAMELVPVYLADVDKIVLRPR